MNIAFRHLLRIAAVFAAIPVTALGAGVAGWTVMPLSSDNIESSPWGVQFNPLPPHIALNVGSWDPARIARETDRLLEAAAAAGVKWVRFSINWSTVQDRDGAFHWDYVDRAVRGLVARKISVCICLNGGHPAYTQAMSVRGPVEMDAWLRFVEAITRRYGADVKQWEIWNEPNTVWFWKPAPVAAEYVELVKRSAPVIRANVPGAVILGGSVARLDLPFAESTVALGLAEVIDVFTIHPYAEMPEAILTPIRVPVKTPLQYVEADHQVAALAKLLAGTKVAIWQAECGYPSAANSLGWTGHGPWGEIIQAKWVLRRGLVDLSFGSAITGYFALADYREGNPDKHNAKGLLRLDSLEPKPAYRAFQNAAAVLRGRLETVAETGFVVADVVSPGSFHGAKAGDVRVIRMRNGEHEFVAYWLPWRAQEMAVPATVDVVLKGVTNPVLVDLLTGSVRELPPEQERGARRGLPLADYPLLIAERGAVPTR